MPELFANNAKTTLNGAITNVATTLVVTSATGFPSSGNFRIKIDSEIMLVTAVSGTTFTVTRAQESTSAAAHSDQAPVAHILTSGAMAQFRADTIQTGTFASRPAAGVAGRLYRPTDGNILFVDNGSSWLPFGPTVPLVTPPSAASFTIIQTGSNASLVDDAGGLYFSALQRVTSEDGIFAAQANPGGTGAAYTLTVGFVHLPGGRNGAASGFYNYHVTGIGIYRADTTQLRDMTLYTDSAGALHLQVAGKTGLTANGAASIDIGAYPLLTGPMVWLRVSDDGTTNRTWSVSPDGRHFKAVFIETRTTGFTSQPDNIGLYINPYNADAAMNVLSYSLTSP